MSIQKKRPHVVQQSIATLLKAAVERGDDEAAYTFARQAVRLARARAEDRRQRQRDRADIYRSLGMVRTRNGQWE